MIFVINKVLTKSIMAIPTKECIICVSNSRNFIKCPFCDNETCTKCAMRFLLDRQDDTPICMSCNKVWSLEFVAQNTTLTFHNKKYREHRARIQYERQRILLPDTQNIIEKRKEATDRINILLEENDNLNKIIIANNAEINELYTGIRNCSKDDTDRKKFVRACPVADCKGFLSTALKCGLCSVWVCKNCFEPKNGKIDDEHVCDPNVVENITLLKNDTKPCPNCAEMIYKISGCDQMYCTTCNTAFSWDSGKIEKGVIHNPHYFELQRQLNNGVIPRQPGDVLGNCMDTEVEYDIHYFPAFIRNSNVWNIIRQIDHMEVVIIPKFEVDFTNTELDLRIEYLLDKISEKKWKSELQRRKKKEEKNESLLHVTRTFIVSAKDLILDIKRKKEINNFYNSMEILRKYINTEYKKIGETYMNVYPYIDKEFNYIVNWKNVLPELL